MIELNDKKPEELQAIILQAQAELEARVQGKRKDVVSQIHKLAASINAVADIQFQVDRRSAAVSARYSDPNTGKTWTGRGLVPKWLKAYINNGRSKDEFLINK